MGHMRDVSLGICPTNRIKRCAFIVCLLLRRVPIDHLESQEAMDGQINSEPQVGKKSKTYANGAMT